MRVFLARRMPWCVRNSCRMGALELVLGGRADSSVVRDGAREAEVEAVFDDHKVVATGRSDFPNQINNVLVFPGIFRGALDVRATEITEEMKIGAAKAIASLVTDEELTEDYIIPSPFDKRVCSVVAKEVGRVAREQGIAKA